ncbi:MAG: M23 family metallopeptidase [Myxococcales bacterium]|nr:M23 family metallopeptidase [Myxococcales bacterium]
MSFTFLSLLAACGPSWEADTRKPTPPHRTGAAHDSILSANEKPSSGPATGFEADSGAGPFGEWGLALDLEDISAEVMSDYAHSAPDTLEVERSIRQFQLRRGASDPLGWPPFLESVDAYLTLPVDRLRPSPLIRARVAAEFELDQESRRPGGAPPELVRMVQALVARIDRRMRDLQAVGRHEARAGAWLKWPLEAGIISSGFGPRRDPFERVVRFHAGVDLAAEEREPVLAAADGVVVFAGPAGNAGLTVKIRHAPRLFTLYAHLSAIMVKEGQEIGRGDVLGLVGHSGRATGPHLHLALIRDGKPVDPLEHLEETVFSFSDRRTGVGFGKP